MCFVIIHDGDTGMLQQRMHVQNPVVGSTRAVATFGHAQAGAQKGRQGRSDLCEQPNQIRVGRTIDIQIASADVIQGCAIAYDDDLGVLQQRMYAQNRCRA